MNMKTAQKRAIVYARLSPTPRGEEAKGGNLDQQVERSQARCDAEGWQVVATISEKDTSATSRKPREGWLRAVSMVKAGEADIIVSRHYDRMYRKVRDLEDLCDLAETTGVSLIAVEAGEIPLDLTTGTGRAQARFMAVGAQLETDIKAERQRLGHERRAKAGRPWWTARPFGFERNGEQRQTESDALRQAYTDLLNGVTLYTIAKRWNEAGIRTPNEGRRRTRKDGTEGADPGTWRSSNLRGLLLNPRNAAIHTYKGQETGIEASWEPIVSREVYVAAKRLLSDPKRKVYENDGNKRRGLLTGIAECGKVVGEKRCGGKMVLIRNKPTKDGTRLQKYTCRECRGVSIPSDYLDAEAIARLARHRTDEWRERATVQIDTDEQDADRLRAERTGLTERKALLAEQYVKGLVDLETMTAGVKVADEALEDIDAQLADQTIAREQSPLMRHADELVDELQVISFFQQLRTEGNEDEARAILRAEIEHLICLPRRKGDRLPKSADVEIQWRDGKASVAGGHHG